MKTTNWLFAALAMMTLAAGCGAGPEAVEISETQQGISYESSTVPTCAELGAGSFSKTISPVTDGSHALDASDSVTLTTFANGYFNWAASLPMGALIVPGGTGAKVYLYDAGVTANSGLSGPVDPSTGAPSAPTSLTFCYDKGLDLFLDVLAKGLRTKQWTVDKSVDQSSVTLSEGQSATATYTVVVDQSSYSEGSYGVEGRIKVKNTEAIAATVTGVAVTVDTTAVTLSCPVSFPTTLQAGSEFVCTFYSSLPDTTTRDVNATVTTSGQLSGAKAHRTLNFAYAAYRYTDRCVKVTDDLYGDLGWICDNETPKTFTYTMAIGPYTVCGDYSVVNTATATTDTTGTTISDSATVAVSLPCQAAGCTLTPGYWKTHSSYGPAPYDSTWAQLSAGADTAFFSSGLSYYEALWAAPRGDAYIILAHAFIAAQLNALNGASRPEAVDTAYQAALTLLQNATPQSSSGKGKKGKGDSGIDRKAFIDAAKVLDDYNNGITGPGHCS